ncbi:hypothetical protein [Paenibacillus sp. Leaf72]|nr:hypothetical protein [Paenibacillus sp. Leaf72]
MAGIFSSTYTAKSLIFCGFRQKEVQQQLCTSSYALPVWQGETAVAILWR